MMPGCGAKGARLWCCFDIGSVVLNNLPVGSRKRSRLSNVTSVAKPRENPYEVHSHVQA